jgi:hypothetical protein
MCVAFAVWRRWSAQDRGSFVERDLLMAVMLPRQMVPARKFCAKTTRVGQGASVARSARGECATGPHASPGEFTVLVGLEAFASSSLVESNSPTSSPSLRRESMYRRTEFDGSSTTTQYLRHGCELVVSVRDGQCHVSSDRLWYDRSFLQSDGGS